MLIDNCAYFSVFFWVFIGCAAPSPPPSPSRATPTSQATVDKLKSLAEWVTLSLTHQGDFHLVVDGPGVALGEGFPSLEVLPAHVAAAASEPQ